MNKLPSIHQFLNFITQTFKSKNGEDTPTDKIAKERFTQTEQSHPSPSLKNRISPNLLTKSTILEAAKSFHAQLKTQTFPTLGNGKTTAIDQVEALYDEKTMANSLKNTRILIHPTVSTLIDDFLSYKMKFGSKIEKKLYASMDKEAFIARLLTKRPLVFMGTNDAYKLKNGKSGYGGFESVGTEREKDICLADYISYDEMEIAAMIGVSVPTRFINKGNRSNRGFIDATDNYEKEGICMGLVGARLEKEGYMEYQRMMITPTQNTRENGYGPLPADETKDNALTAKMRLFAKFYQVDHFPTFDEVNKSNSADIKPAYDGFISKKMYQRRIKINIENYLFEAKERAKAQGKKAYAQPYGWGLSAWIKDDIQRKWFLEAFLEVLSQRSYPHIADVDFSFVMKYQYEGSGLEQYLKQDGTTIHSTQLHFPKSGNCRELCAKLTGTHQGKLLVNSYGWDGNSYSGNEYWDGALEASGDPIMMCASPLQVFAQTPEINPYLTRNLTYTN